MRTKSLDPERNEAARAYVRDIVDRDFKGNVTAAARRWHISQPMLSEFLKGSRGAGMKLLEAVARHAGSSIDEIIGRPSDVATQTPLDIAVAYLGEVISPQAIERTRGKLGEPATDDWTALQWGRALIACQRDLLTEAEDVPMPRIQRRKQTKEL